MLQLCCAGPSDTPEVSAAKPRTLPARLPACLPQAQAWLCVSCQLQHGRQRPATKLFLHTMGYLHQQPPHIQDMGPTPACASQECATYTMQMAEQLKAELLAAVRQGA